MDIQANITAGKYQVTRRVPSEMLAAKQEIRKVTANYVPAALAEVTGEYVIKLGKLLDEGLAIQREIAAEHAEKMKQFRFDVETFYGVQGRPTLEKFWEMVEMRANTTGDNTLIGLLESFEYLVDLLR